MPKYFSYVEIREISMQGIEQLVASRPVVFGVQPHGVFAFGGACAGVNWSKSFWNPAELPTAAAASVMKTPLIKHIVGLFGTRDAHSKSLTAWLKQGKSIVLYIGGIAELFLTQPDKEVIFAKQRKGFVKLALRSGAEIIPVYHFGNTSVLSIINTKFLRSFARRTGMSVTWFWGRWGTVIPRPNKIVVAIGRPLEMPKKPTAEPTDEMVDMFHAKYLQELTRIFEAYKQYNPDYKSKQLHFE